MTKAIRITALAALLMTPTVAQAQDAVGEWRGIDLASLDTVYVTEDGGRQTEGKLLRLDTDSLVMLVDGSEQRFDKGRVLRIEKRGDSLKNGTLIGLGLGLVFGSIAAGLSDCPGDDPGGDCTSFKVAGFATGVGIYTALGTAIDAMIVGRRRVFDAERPGIAARITPGGVQLSVGFTW
jgi:hypothetical protein